MDEKPIVDVKPPSPAVKTEATTSQNIDVKDQSDFFETKEEFMAEIKRQIVEEYAKVASNRKKFVLETNRRHEKESCDLKKRYGGKKKGKYSRDKYQVELQKLKTKHHSDHEFLKYADAETERQWGFSRRQLHQNHHVNYCETCFKLIKPGVQTIQFGCMTPLGPQYCGECDEDSETGLEDWEGLD